MRNSAYIKTRPVILKFALNFSDNSGERLSISISPKQKDILIKDGCGEGVLLSIDDIDWLRQALDDVKEILQLPNNEQGDERSVASEVQ